MAIKVSGTTVIDDSRNLTNIQSINTTVTATEISYLDGVTSSIQTQLDLKSPSASPALTGTPTAPTAAAGTSTTQLATTAFVTAADTTLMSNHIAASDPHTQYLTKTGAQSITIDGGAY
jgi:hypothetical protein